MAAVNIKLDMGSLLLIGIFGVSAPSLLSGTVKSKEPYPLVLPEEEPEELPVFLMVDPRIEQLIIQFMEEDNDEIDDDLCDDDQYKEQELERERVSDTIFLTSCPDDVELVTDLIMTGK